MARRLSMGAYTHINELSDLEDAGNFDMEILPPTDLANPNLIDKPPEAAVHRSNTRSFARKLFAKVTVRAVMALLLWYTFSISLSVYNKYMFSGEGMDFRFPILATSIHQLVQTVSASVALVLLRLPFQGFPEGNKLRAIATLASSGDIGLGNSSLLLVTLSFYTMIKSSALGFVLLFSALFGIELFSWRLTGIILVMTTGVLMMVFGETNFNLLGFLCVLGASCCSGLRWAATKLLLNSNTPDPRKGPEKVAHPLQAIVAIAPGMFVCLLIWGLILEGPKNFVSAPMWNHGSIIHGVGIMLFPGFLAFCMTWAEFELLNATGPLTLAVAGICKEVATIVISVLVFHDKLTPINGLGIVVTIAAIGLYHYHRISS